MTDEFKPYRMKPVTDGYRVDELTEAYADAWDEGVWVKEFGAPKGFIAAAGSVYMLQELEFLNPEAGEIDVAELTMGDCIEMSLPGNGETRAEAVRNAVQAFKDSHLWEKHQEMHQVAGEVTDGE